MERVIDCPICYDPDRCFEDMQEKFRSYMCFNCGFMSNSLYTEENLDKVENTSKLVNELKYLDDEEMNGLYNHPKVKAHVSFTHGEGFGRPLLEASLSEKPVIAPNWSGHVDFLNDKDAILLPGGLNDVKKESFPKNMYVKGAQWFTVNYNYASKMLKDVFDNYSKYTVRAKRLAIKNQTKFSLDAMTKKFEKILDQHLPKFEEQPQQVNLKLPKLKKVDVNSNNLDIKLPNLVKI